MNNKLTHRIATLFLILLLAGTKLSAQEDRNQGITQSYLHGWEYALKAGFSIGGTSPLPLPKEIRTINGYTPGGVVVSIEGNSTKWLDKKKIWGITFGVRLESKKMTTDANVKNYHIEIINTDNGKPLVGLWTGNVKTKVNNSYLTVPVLANYKISSRWKLVAGPYFSYLIDGNFDGHVYEGHLRTPDATGQRVDFTDESIATYDFSNDLRKFQWRMACLQAPERLCRPDVGTERYFPEGFPNHHFRHVSHLSERRIRVFLLIEITALAADMRQSPPDSHSGINLYRPHNCPEDFTVSDNILKTDV